MSEIMDRDHERLVKIIGAINFMKRCLHNKAGPLKPSICGETFLNDKEMAEILKVSRRTLIDYRQKGILPYYIIEGRILYKESEINKILEERYIDAYRLNDEPQNRDIR